MDVFYIKTVIAKLFASVLVAAAFEMFIEVRSFLILLFILVLCDLITGVSAARKKGEKINSKGLRRTVSKFVMYSIAIILSKGMEHVFGIPEVVYVVAFYICTTEFISNLENIGAVTGINIAERIKDIINSRIKID